MLTLDNEQPDLFDGWISPTLMELSEELKFADEAFKDERLLSPFLERDRTIGRPSTAVATFLRMMYLKYRYQMSYGAPREAVYNQRGKNPSSQRPDRLVATPSWEAERHP